MNVTIRERRSRDSLASGELGQNVVKYEGNWYFVPESVERDRLRVTERTYTCPYKGTCNWVDYVGPDETVVQNVAWVYPDPKPGHEIIRDRYGFYPGTRGATTQDED